MGSYPVATMIGGMIGGIIPIILLAMLFEKIMFSMVFDDPVMGKGASVITAWVAASIVYGLLSSRGSFNPRGFLMYGAAALIVGVFFIRRGFILRGMQDELEAEQERAVHQRIDYGAARPFE